MSKLNDKSAMFARYWRLLYPSLEQPEPEFRFAKDALRRNWRFDAAFPRYKIGIEIDGGAFVAGRHNRGGGFEKDHEKFNAAALLGWRVFRFTPGMINRDPAGALEMVRKAMEGSNV